MKTRLAAGIGTRHALQVYMACAGHVLKQMARRANHAPEVPLMAVQLPASTLDVDYHGDAAVMCPPHGCFAQFEAEADKDRGKDG